MPAARIGRARSLRTSNPPASPRTTSRAAAELPSTLQFLQILWTVNQALELASKRMALQLGVTGPQRLVIRLIGRFPGMSAGEVAATMRTDPSTLTGVLQRLEASRLIRRARDGSDARRVLLTLTGRGRAIDRLKAGTIEHAVDLALRGVPSRDISCTARTMWRITSTLQQMGDTAPLTVTAQGGLRVSGAAESRDHGRSAARPPSAADRA